MYVGATLGIYQLSSFVDQVICNPLLYWLQSIPPCPVPPCVVNLFDISDWKVGWLEVAVGLPIVIPGGGRTTLLRLPAAGDIIVNLHKPQF